MTHATGVLFDLTFLPETPESILDVFRFLAKYNNSDKSTESNKLFLTLLNKCPRAFIKELELSDFHLIQNLFQLTTSSVGKINGWKCRTFDESKKRFISAGDCYINPKELSQTICELLDTLIDYLVMEDTGTICARAIGENDIQERVFWFDWAAFFEGDGYYHGVNANTHPNHRDRADDWVFYGDFQPPANYLKLRASKGK